MYLKSVVCLLAVCFVLPFYSVSEGNEKVGFAEILDRITEDMLRDYIQTLQNLGPRVTGTATSGETATYISSQFQEYELSVRQHVWEYGGYEDVNVEGTLEGVNTSSDDIFVICAHHDTVSGSPGADDNGSGTAAVLAAAKILSDYKFEHTIRFVTFSGEEEGLLGSHEYAREAREKEENIVGVINADMIGYSLSSEGMTHVYAQEVYSSTWITNISVSIGESYPEIIDLIIERVESRPYSDHASFINYNYDAIFLIEYEFNDYYHSSEDTIDKMDLDYATRVTRLIVGTLIELAELAEGDWEPPQVSLEKPQGGHLYLWNKEIIPLPLSMTIVLGGIEVEAHAIDNESGVSEVEFYIDDVFRYSDNEAPYTFQWDERAFFVHTLKVKAYDNERNEASVGTRLLIFNF